MHTSIYRKISIRLFIAAMFGAVVALAITHFYINFNIQKQMEEQMQAIELSLQDVLELPLWNLNEETVKKIGSSYHSNEFISMLEIKDSFGNVYYFFEKDDFSLDDLTDKIDIAHNNECVGYVVVSLNSKFYTSFNKQAQIINLGILLFTILIVMATLYFSFRRLINPIDNFKSVVEKTKHGDYTARVHIKTGDELEDLALNFNRMIARIQKTAQETEKKVQTRTADLEKLNRAMTGRELKMMELKEKIKELEDNRSNK